jgi:hypothetical protein
MTVCYGWEMEAEFRRLLEKSGWKDCYVAQYIDVAEDSDSGMANRIRCKAYFLIARIRSTSPLSQSDWRDLQHLTHNILHRNDHFDYRQYGRWVDAATVDEHFGQGILNFKGKCALIADDCTKMLGKVRVTDKERVMLHQMYIALTSNDSELNGICWDGDRVFINNPRIFKERFPSVVAGPIPSDEDEYGEEYGECGSSAVLRWALSQMRERMGFEIETLHDGSMKLMHPLYQKHMQLYHRIGTNTVVSDDAFDELLDQRETLREYVIENKAQEQEQEDGNEEQEQEEGNGDRDEEQDSSKVVVHGKKRLLIDTDIDSKVDSKEKRRKVDSKEDQ